MTVEEMPVRVVLERRRAEIGAELDELTAVQGDSTATVSYGKRVGDGTALAVERLNRVGAVRALAAMLADVERALAKLDEATYGFCDSCGAAIPPNRLDARPWSTRCMRCAGSSRRPRS